MIIHKCETCGTTFTKPNNPNRPYQFCSYACRAKSSPNNRKQVACKFCGDDYLAWPFEIRQGRKYCSKPCADRGKDRGLTTESHRIRTSTAYANWRKQVFERDNYTCVLCNASGVVLNADHIKKFADYPELRLNVDNGRTLCVPCHLSTPTFGNHRKLVKP